jgi:Protein of unknown function (DUF2934)
MMTTSSGTQGPSFDLPQEADWHRMIAEAAYYLAQDRGFLGEHALDDWLAAEQQVRQVISPIGDTDATMNDTNPKQPDSDAKPARRPSTDDPPIKMPHPTDEKQAEIPKVGSRDAPGG